MLIGELSKRSQLSRDTIRYYEKLGLFQVAKKQCPDNNYKNYSAEVLERLHQIQLLKQCGFTLQEIHALLQSEARRDACSGLPERLAEKISSIEKKVTDLMSYKAALLKIHQSCTGTCGVSKGLPDCIEIGSQNGRLSARG